jgi:hypothetical protein
VTTASIGGDGAFWVAADARVILASPILRNIVLPLVADCYQLHDCVRFLGERDACHFQGAIARRDAGEAR